MSRLSRVSAPNRPAAVLWDMDGTLVDTEPYWIAAEHALVADAGGRWSDDLAAQLIGQDLRVSAEFIRANSPVTLSPEEIIEALLERVVAAVRDHVPWRPGARELLLDAVRDFETRHVNPADPSLPIRDYLVEI